MDFDDKRPKLKDKVYGEMFWEDWDEDESYWYAPVETDAGGRFDLLIRADSPADFMTVAGTHSIFRKLLANLDAIQDEMIAEILENSRELFKKKRQRDFAREAIKNSLRLFLIKIYGDLSSELQFVGNVGEDEDPDETLYALLDPQGIMTEAGIEEL